MVYSLYDATVVMAKGALGSLTQILKQAEEHPDSSSFPASRITEDMNPLTFQVHYATYQAQALAAKLSGGKFEQPQDDLDTFEKMHQRIQLASDALDRVDRDRANEIGETMTSHTVQTGTMEVPVKALVGSLYMSNIYFHVAMAYAILRKEGVPLGKRYWSRPFVSQYL